MDSIYLGNLNTPRGRRSAWLDSLLVDHGALRLAWTNFATIAPGLFRSNHPTPGRLARLARRRGLRSVINLRGATGNGSDALSRTAAARLGLAFYDVPLSSGRAPSRERLETLLAAMAQAPRPVLLHCKSGADRAGFAAALHLILQGEPVVRARRQLSLRHGHLRRSRAGVLDDFLDAFARDGEGRMGLIEWIRTRYDEAALNRGATGSLFSGFLHTRLLARE